MALDTPPKPGDDAAVGIGRPVKILHTSDLHLQGKRHRRLLRLLSETAFDVWVDTGDFAWEPVSLVATEQEIKAKQRRWWKSKGLAERIAASLAGRPGLMVPGNHDRYVALGELVGTGVTVLRDGAVAADEVGETLGRLVVGGVTFAGTRVITWEKGRWPGEVGPEQAERLWGQLDGVDVLMTHGSGQALGLDVIGTHSPLPGLADALDLFDVPIHLHGHVHEKGGQARIDGPTLTVNAATQPMLVDTETREATPVSW